MSFILENGVLTGYEEAPDASVVVIPNGVRKIGRAVFSGCKRWPFRQVRYSGYATEQFRL